MNFDADTHYSPREIFVNVPDEIRDMPRLVKGEDGLDRIFSPLKNLNYVYRDTMDSLKMRTDAMKEAGFDKSMLLVANSTIPENHISVEAAYALMQRWNDRVSELVKRDDHFVAAAQVPATNVELAIKEAERAVTQLGFKAIQIQGSWGAKNAEDAEWWPFYEKVEKLGVPLWQHATGGLTFGLNSNLPGYQQLARMPRPVAILNGFLWQAQALVTGMIFSGLLDRYPKLKFVLCEVDASWVPHFMTFMELGQDLAAMHRMESSHAKMDWPYKNLVLKKKASQYFRENFYFVLSNASHIEIKMILPFLVNNLHLQNNLMIESDFDHQEGSLDIVRRVRTLQEIDEVAKERICGQNAAELLKLDWKASQYVFA